MSVFGSYAHYYDLLYRDKNYGAEAQFVHELIQRHAPDAKSILELGCGTGMHAALLSERGYSLCGVDLSSKMLERANQRVQTLPEHQVAQLTFQQGDVRSVRLDRSFDVVVSLFHVISYQTINEDLQAAFATAKQHLKPGGVFLFDCWYGPAVLSDRPSVRVKRLADEILSVTRIAEPVLYPNQNWVDVNYQILIQDSLSIETLHETHRMRYLFQPEVELLLSQAGFSYVAAGEWMTNREPGCDTWSVYFIGRC
ncbi:class I SAM-dependent methyltransferase [Leptolyngbya sp. FACHB-36]|uniref:class I SAM-dependent DNA methyltransferase n=1 Tax=Leptolyngbya sp. FACHB-36 TaxID=2692808 RepID=UPI0016815808|nr:class I SAM-dependent methyltransferase [Leptolyngbya sp. FACHB-36]MBD2020711.1 class I SAM-dependent methyltransferase [Leptolyngbya sp. FACHB-36]